MPCWTISLRFFVERGAAILRAHLHDLARLLPRAHDLEALFDGVSQRLFDINVLARLERRDGHIVVQVLRRHDEDGVDGLVGQQVVIVLVGLGRGAPDGLHAILGAGDVAIVGIADRRDLDIVGGGGMQPVEAGVAAGANTDPADVDLIRWRLAPRSRPGRGNRGGLQKIAPIQFVRHGTSLFQYAR